jgi:hypothetical protein
MAQPSAWLTNFLATLEAPGGSTRQPTTQEIAASIIRRSNKYSYNTRQIGGGLGNAQLLAAGSGKKPGEKGPSTVQRVMDVLSRPLYGTMEALKQDAAHGGLIDKPHLFGWGDEDGEAGDIAKGIWQGVSGKRKTTSKDVYKQLGLGEGKGVGGFVRNLATDVLLDPLNIIPVGWIGKGKAAKEAADELASTVVKEGTATERVEKALAAKNSPEYVLGQTSRNKSVPNLRATPARRPSNTDEELTGVPDLWRETINPSPTAPSSVLRATNSSRQIPGAARAIPEAAPVINRGGAAAVSGVPDLWKSLLGDNIPAVPQQVKIPEVVKKTVTPKTKAAAVVTTPVPTAAAAKIPFKLDVNKIATIEVARALGSRGKALEDYQRGKQLIDSGGSIKLHALNGAEMGDFNAAKIQDYLRTGKVDAPKESEVIDYATATPDEIATYEGHLFSEKSAPQNYYIKTVDEQGQEQLISLTEVRKRIIATKKSKKLKDTLPDEAVAPQPVSVLDTPVEDFKIADAEDIIEAAGEGSETAINAMQQAVEAVTTPRTRNLISEEGGRAVAKIAERYVGLVKAATFRNSNFNPAKQANAFRELEKALIDEGLMKGFTRVPPAKLASVSTGKVAAARRSLAMKHLEALEDAMTAAGHPPMTFGRNGYPMRMSDLINAAGGIHVVLAPKGMHLTNLFGNQAKLDEFLAANPGAAQLAATSEAAHAAYTADLIDKGKSAALSAAHKAEIDPSLTTAESAAAVREAPGVAADVVRAEESLPNPTAREMASANVKEILKNAKPPVHRVTEAYSKRFDRTVYSGKVGKETVAGSVAKDRVALDVAGVSVPGIKAEISTADNAAATQGLYASLMSKFKPDFRQEDLRNIYVENRSLFQTQTARWAEALNQTWKKYPKQTRVTAFESLQRGLPAGDEVTQAAAKEFQDTMESMFGASGFKDAVETDVLREAITLDDINKSLRLGKSKFQFSSEVTDELGNTTKVPWLDSWKYHNLNGQDPIEFIKQTRNAVDHAMLEKTMFDQLSTVWGKPNGRTQFAYPRLDGVEFPADIKPQVAHFLKALEDVQQPSSKLAVQYDTGLRIWKTGVTIYSPSHHIRNMMGDITLAWLAGVNNPKVYAKAASVLRSNRHLYSDMAKVDDLVGAGSVTRSMARQAKVPIVRAAGRQLDAQQIYTIMYKRGLLPHSKTIEDIPGGVPDLKLPQPLGGRGKKVARHVSESREHFVRTAHFIDAIGKSKAKSLEGAIEEATRITRKWHPDGLDLTDFEHRYMRRVFPFYSWTRKAIPLIAEGMARRPAKIIAPNKALYNLQVSMGIDPESLSEPFPVDKEFPDWIRDMAYGPVLGGGSHILGANLNPVTSVTEQLGNDPRRGLAGMLTPALRIPGELISQNDWQTGQPMSSMDKTEYIDKQVPLLSIANRLTGGNLGAGSVEALATGDKSAMLNHKVTDNTAGNTAGRDAFLNYLLAAGIINTQTPANLKSAEFDRRDRIAKENRKRREQLSR